MKRKGCLRCGMEKVYPVGKCNIYGKYYGRHLWGWLYGKVHKIKVDQPTFENTRKFIYTGSWPFLK